MEAVATCISSSMAATASSTTRGFSASVRPNGRDAISATLGLKELAEAGLTNKVVLTTLLDDIVGLLAAETSGRSLPSSLIRGWLPVEVAAELIMGMVLLFPGAGTCRPIYLAAIAVILSI